MTLSDGDADRRDDLGGFIGVEEGSFASAEAVMEETVDDERVATEPAGTPPAFRVSREARENTPCIGSHWNKETEEKEAN